MARYRLKDRNWNIFQIFPSEFYDGPELPRWVLAVSGKQAMKKAFLAVGYQPRSEDEIADSHPVLWFEFQADEFNEILGAWGLTAKEAVERLNQRFFGQTGKRLTDTRVVKIENLGVHLMDQGMCLNIRTYFIPQFLARLPIEVNGVTI